MRKAFALSLVLLFLVSIISGCIGGEQTTTTQKVERG